MAKMIRNESTTSRTFGVALLLLLLLEESTRPCIRRGHALLLLHVVLSRCHTRSMAMTHVHSNVRKKTAKFDAVPAVPEAPSFHSLLGGKFFTKTPVEF